MSFNENTRVKIPAILHLGKLGYDYLSLSIIKPDETTNIFTELFTQSLLRINPERRWCINNGKAKNPLPQKAQGATVPIRAEMGIPRAVMIFMAAMRT